MANSGRPLHKTDFDPERYNQGKDKSISRRKLAAERKQFKRNQQPKGPRRKDWTPSEQNLEALDGLDDDYFASFERIMPLDENDRRRALERAAILRSTSQQKDIVMGQDPPSNPDKSLVQGMVIAIASALCRVAIGNESLLCHIRGTIHATETGFTNAVAVGDQVLVRRESVGYGVVEFVLPRHSFLARPDVFYTHLQQLVVANADQLLIVASWRDPIIWFELIDRYLVAAAHNQLPALICINKVDLATSRDEYERELHPYLALGIPCMFTSAQSGEGIGELRTRLQGRTSVLAGLSGVGKSSLLTAVQPALNLRVSGVSEHSGEGRHTTTQATMLHLDDQTWVVDTPGIREFGLSGIVRSQLIGYFPEIQEAAHSCRLRDCSHRDEPVCRVKEAVAEGLIAESRYHSYSSISASLGA